MKKKSLFDSLGFNAVMSIVSITVLIDQVINKKYIMILIWLIITYHFVKITKEQISKK